MKVRTIITQDGEVDDQNSLRHFLLYSNEVELLGIVQTSSKFHWKGTSSVPEDVKQRDAYRKPYRWPGTDWMFRVIDDYEADYPNLIKHSADYPSPDYLRSITKIGNVDYEGDTAHSTEGSLLIQNAILNDDERKLYIQVWGGCNTVARALMDIQEEYQSSAQWSFLRETIMKKIVITACGMQDDTYQTYLAEEWPRIQFVKTLQMGSYAYPWLLMPECESKDTLRAGFLKEKILTGKCALTNGYCTWLDGTYYEGEKVSSQFGTNPNIAAEWFGSSLGLPAGSQYDFLSEGDSPTFLFMFNWGLRTLEDFSYGGVSGRYHPVPNMYNSKGEALNLWDTSMDVFTDRNGQSHLTESMWPYVADIQRDFAARVELASSHKNGEHPPVLHVAEGVNLTACVGERVTLHAEAFSPHSDAVKISFRVYTDISVHWAEKLTLDVHDGAATMSIPSEAKPGDILHIIVKAQAQEGHRLVHYQQVIITVQSA